VRYQIFYITLLEQNSYFKFKTSNRRHIGDMSLAILGSELSEFREIL